MPRLANLLKLLAVDLSDSKLTILVHDPARREPGGWLTEQTGGMGDTLRGRQPIGENALDSEMPDVGKSRICDGR